MGLFREQALAAYSNPDARGGLVRAAPPSGLALFSVIVASLLCATAVAATTRAHVTIDGRGVVALEHGAVVVRATRDATVTSVLVRPGARLERDLQLLSLDGERVAAPTTGHVEFVDVREGDIVTRGTPLVEMVPDREPLIGYVLVPTAERSRVTEGQRVLLRVRGEIVATGTVAAVAARPISESREAAIFGAVSHPRESSLLVRVALPNNRALASGTAFVGEIQLGSRSALSVLVPSLGGEPRGGAAPDANRAGGASEPRSDEARTGG